MSEKPIGIFDSGVGGLTVMAAIKRHLPRESLVYLGDTARVPYGTKSADTILRYTGECCDFLAGKGVKAIVVACNSASAHAFPYLGNQFHFPILGVIESGVQAALEATKNRHIGVIGTEATIESNVYAKELKKREERTTVTSLACPLFVSLVEVGWIDHDVTRQVAEHYLESLTQDGLDTLILGCTHYPLLKNLISQVLGPKVVLIDSAEMVAKKLKALLKTEGLENPSPEISKHHLYVTDLPRNFETVARRFLGEDIPSVKRVSL